MPFLRTQSQKRTMMCFELYGFCNLTLLRRNLVFMNTHSFDVNVAVKFGVPVAIVINHIAFWIQKNQANEKHFHDGRYWTYNSIKAFQVLFPYWSFKQMRAVLEKLEETGLILVGNYNQITYDRTSWYALSDEGLKLYNITPPVDNLVPICPKGQMGEPSEATPFAQKGKPIPDIKPDIKPNNKSSCFKSGEKTNKFVDNSKKHDWATPKPPTFSDPTKQSTSYKHEEYEKPSQEAIDAAMLKLPRHIRPKRLRKHETNELPTGTTVQPEVPERTHPSSQSVRPIADRQEAVSPPIRGADRLLATSSARSYLEKAGMASQEIRAGDGRA